MLAVFSLGCGSTPEPATAPDIAAAVDGSNAEPVTPRVVSFYLQSAANAQFSVGLAGRTINVYEQVITRIQQAQASYTVGNTRVTVTGSSCNSLAAQYPSLSDCTITESTRTQPGQLIASGVTNVSGEASFTIPDRPMTVRVADWPTTEDPLCGWSASEQLPADVDSLVLPLMVFCQ